VPHQRTLVALFLTTMMLMLSVLMMLMLMLLMMMMLRVHVTALTRHVHLSTFFSRNQSV
jgi:hypothetical protein